MWWMHEGSKEKMDNEHYTGFHLNMVLGGVVCI